jgi:hypothetical protein
MGGAEYAVAFRGGLASVKVGSMLRHLRCATGSPKESVIRHS